MFVFVSDALRRPFPTDNELYVPKINSHPVNGFWHIREHHIFILPMKIISILLALVFLRVFSFSGSLYSQVTQDSLTGRTMKELSLNLENGTRILYTASFPALRKHKLYPLVLALHFGGDVVFVPVKCLSHYQTPRYVRPLQHSIRWLKKLWKDKE